jgi:hypothetical protein
VHTCDKRRSRSWIHERFPEFRFEEGFEEEDILWDPKVRETKAEVAERARKVLDYVFEKDTSSTCEFDDICSGLSLMNPYRYLCYCTRGDHRRISSGHRSSPLWAFDWRCVPLLRSDARN